MSARRATGDRLASGGRAGRVVGGLAILGVAALACTAVLVAVGALGRLPASGLVATDLRVSWLLPVARLAADVAAGVTVGCLVAAALLLPGRGTVSPAGYRWLRRSTWPALGWAVAAAAALPALFAEFLYTTLDRASPPALLAFVRDVPAGTAQLAAVVLAVVVALGSRWVLTTAGARVLLVLAALAVVPPLLAEYAEAEGGAGKIAVVATGLVLHVLGALAWAGALAALLLDRLPGDQLITAVRRYSRLAPVLVLLLAAGGLAVAVTALDRPALWWGTSYGRLVLLKAAALAVLAGLGWWHRRHALPALVGGRAGIFRRIAVVELLVMSATFGLAVGLSRTLDPALEAGLVDVHAAAAVSAAAAG